MRPLFPCIIIACLTDLAKEGPPVPLHSKGKIRVYPLQELSFSLVHLVGVSEYGHFTAEA